MGGGGGDGYCSGPPQTACQLFIFIFMRFFIFYILVVTQPLVLWL